MQVNFLDSPSQIISCGYRQHFAEYSKNASLAPLLLLGDSYEVLKDLPSESIDFCMTSPPYWGKREYKDGGIGLETDYRDYITSLGNITREIFRVLKPTGSFWLNIGDSYDKKRLLGLPWRVAFNLTDTQGWILRNDVVWNKVKGGPDNTKDRLRNVHEMVFHFVKMPKGYFYDADSIRSTPKTAKISNGSVISATGVSGVRYKRQIELSTILTEEEKKNAFAELEKVLASIAKQEISDFRMIIRGQHRTTHSDSAKVSGRAKELVQRGFYFLKYHPNGSKPGDVWDIMPEDTQQRKDLHFAPYPQDLCRIPMVATCPKDGIVLDPFCGTGTTSLVAKQLNRKSVGIDISKYYLDAASIRINLS